MGIEEQLLCRKQRLPKRNCIAYTNRPPLKQTGGFGGRNQNEHHVKTFKKHPVTINALQFFVQYLGAEVEGNCKWHITSIDIPNIDSEIDTLWHTKEEAIQAIQEFIA